VLAPAFLFAGSLQARLPTTYMALGITLTIPILLNLGAHYTGDFAASLNTSVALFAGVGFGAVSMSLLQTVPVDVAINRLLHLSRRDVSRRALGGAPNEARWTSLMIDRTALLLPRLRVSGKSYTNILDDTLNHLRIGHAAGQLHQTAHLITGEAGIKMDELLCSIAARFSATGPMTPAEHNHFDQRIETLTALMASSSFSKRLRILDLLIDLSFALRSTETTDARKHSA